MTKEQWTIHAIAQHVSRSGGFRRMEEIEQLLREQGASLVGFADVTRAKVGIAVPDWCVSGVSIAVALQPDIVREIKFGPTPDYYAEYCRLNDLLNRLGTVTVKYLEKQGHKVFSLPATQAQLDRTSLAVSLPHKTIATLSGLGWIGKCALLITEVFGPAVRLTSVLTDAPLNPSEAIEHSRCADCTVCVDKCPAQAVLGAEWYQGLERGQFFNAFRCHHKAVELSSNIGVSEAICGICISVCPWTRKYLKRVKSAQSNTTP